MPRESVKLTEQQANQMGNLQQLFHNKYLNPDFLHQLISLYVKAIEMFNEENKYMRAYFMDKMQFVLSRPEIITMLEGGGSAIDNIRETVRMTEKVMPEQWQRKKQSQQGKDKKNEKIVNDIDISAKQKINNNNDRFGNYQENHHHHKVEQHNHYYYDESKKNQRNMKIDMKMKLMREVEENMKNIHQQVNQADQKLVKNQQKIKQIGQSQEDKLKQRLERRKRKHRKSVQIKADILKPEGEEMEPEPIIKKEQLVQAQRQLTRAVNKFTVRMTQRQKQKQQELTNAKKGSGRGRVKKIRDLDDDQMLIEQPQQEDVKQKQVNMKKTKGTKQINNQQKPQGRIKTTRRHLDSDEDNL